MNKFLTAASMIALMAVSANAADLPRRATSPLSPAPAMDWSGFYVGLHTAGAYHNSTFGDPEGELLGEDGSSGQASAFRYGVGGSFGYDWHKGSGVFGIVADFTMLNGKEAFVAGRNFSDDGGVGLGNTRDRFENSVNWYSTIRARAGLSFDNVLVYATGGLAIAKREFKVIERGDFDNECAPTVVPDRFNLPFANNECGSKTSVGFAVGAGTEIALTRNVTATLGYLFVGMPTLNRTVSTVTNSGTSDFAISDNFHTVHVGLKYKW